MPCVVDGAVDGALGEVAETAEVVGVVLGGAIDFPWVVDGVDGVVVVGGVAGEVVLDAVDVLDGEVDGVLAGVLAIGLAGVAVGAPIDLHCVVAGGVAGAATCVDAGAEVVVGRLAIVGDDPPSPKPPPPAFGGVGRGGSSSTEGGAGGGATGSTEANWPPIAPL